MADCCYECGRSVAPGSGNFVNRVPSLDSGPERASMGVPYPEGEWLCGECDQLEDDAVQYYRGITEAQRKERGIPDDFMSRTK